MSYRRGKLVVRDHESCRKEVYSQICLELQDRHRDSFIGILNIPRLSILHCHESLRRLPKEQKRRDRRMFHRIAIFGGCLWKRDSR